MKRTLKEINEWDKKLHSKIIKGSIWGVSAYCIVYLIRVGVFIITGN